MSKKYKTKKYAYGGTGHMTPDLMFEQQKGNLDVFNQILENNTKYNGLKQMENIIGGLSATALSTIPGGGRALGNAVIGLGNGNPNTLANAGLLMGLNYGIGKLNNKNNLATTTPENKNVNLDENNNMNDNITKFMTGGSINPTSLIEAEGQELIQTPDGQLSEIQGPSHEQGGINMQIPQDSVIYSKRLKGLDGNTMAKRKEFREKHLLKLEKLLKLNPKDKVLRRTYDRTLRAFEQQEKEDVEYMNYMNIMHNSGQTIPQMATGGIPPNNNNLLYNPGFDPLNNTFQLGLPGDNPNDHYSFYTKQPKVVPAEQPIISEQTPSAKKLVNSDIKPKVVSVLPTKINTIKGFGEQELAELNALAGKYGNTDIYADKKTTNKLSKDFQKNVLKMKDKAVDGIIGKQSATAYLDYLRTLDKTLPILNGIPSLMGRPNPFFKVENFKVPEVKEEPIEELDEIIIDVNRPKNSEVEEIKEEINSPQEIIDKNPYTLGDLIYGYGTYNAGMDPLRITQQQRAGDTPNINFYKDYGNKSLDKLQEAKNLLKYQHDLSLQNLVSERDVALARNKSGARGISTQRALDLATDVQNYKAQNIATASYNNQLAQMMNFEADLLRQADGVIAQGEEKRDLADRQDRDIYYTQLQRDVRNRNTMLQNIGKHINDVKEREFKRNVYSQYGDNLTFNSDGTIINKESQAITNAMKPTSKFWSDKTPAVMGYYLTKLLPQGYRISDDEMNLLDKHGNVVNIEELIRQGQ